MYSVVILVAATSGGDMASFGGKASAGCCGTVAMSSGCHGTSCHGAFIGHRMGGLFAKLKSHGCHGTPVAGCTGTVAMAPVVPPAPVAVPTGCTGSMYSGSCHGSAFLGHRLGGGLFSKHKAGCSGGCRGW
jgi:hypothetical protein